MPAVSAVPQALRAEELQCLLERLEERLRQKDAKIDWMQEIGAALGSYRREQDLLDFIIERLTRIMDAERATFFIMNEERTHLTSEVMSDGASKPLTLELGEGIAGWVAKQGKSVNLKDAYRDVRFRDSFDKLTGFHTRSVLCQPMRNKDGRIIGVVQILNKNRGWFTTDDEALLEAITNTAAMVIENHGLYMRQISRNIELEDTRTKLENRVRELDSLYQMQRTLLKVDELDDVLEAVARDCLKLLPSHACGITVREGDTFTSYLLTETDTAGIFVSAQTERDISLTTWILKSGETRRCNDMSCLPRDRFLEELDIDVKNILAAPLRSDDDGFGTLFLINRKTSRSESEVGYTLADCKLLALAAGHISVAVAQSIGRKRALEEDRLSTIGRMLSGVVHDLKTPLTVVNGYVQLMARSERAEERKAYAKTIKRQFDHLDQMTREVLSYARGESSIFSSKVMLSEFVAELRELLAQEFAGHDITVDINTSEGGEARFDDAKIKRVIFNLARNAREAMPDGGAYRIQFARDGENLVIRSSDTGIGIPESIRQRLFEAFVSSGKAGNSGLGLAIVRKLVADHDGSVTVDSAIGKGTTFEVRFPAFAEERQAVPA